MKLAIDPVIVLMVFVGLAAAFCGVAALRCELSQRRKTRALIDSTAGAIEWDLLEVEELIGTQHQHFSSSIRRGAECIRNLRYKEAVAVFKPLTEDTSLPAAATQCALSSLALAYWLLLAEQDALDCERQAEELEKITGRF